MMTIGILCGLAAAVAQSASYVFSRRFVIGHGGGAFRLMVLGHILMGAVSVILLPLLWPDRMPPMGRLAAPVAGAAGFYMLGQFALFSALRHTEASRASPLLGLKIVVLAAITALVLHRPLSDLQWAAVVLAVAAAFVLNYAGRSVPARALVAVLAACVPFALSDLHIRWLVRSFEHLALFRASLLAVVLCYILTGLVGLALLPWAGKPPPGEWTRALPFAVSWYVAMIFLFASFATIGVVFGNIIQSTRGLISILLGVQLARWGLVHLEAKTSRSVLGRRAAAGAMMALAIIAFAVGQ